MTITERIERDESAQPAAIVGFAARIGVTRVALARVLNARAAISPDMALRLADALGSAETWLHMQANFDLWQAQQKPRPSIERLTWLE